MSGIQEWMEIKKFESTQKVDWKSSLNLLSTMFCEFDGKYQAENF